MPSPLPHSVRFAGVRICYDSRISFDDALSNLRAEMGDTTVQRLNALSAEANTSEAFTKMVEPLVGSSGFMLFATIDHGAWISKFGIKRRVVRFILGNPLIAITMICRDLTAGLFAPVELLLTDSEDRQTCSLTYILPSSLIAIDNDTALLAAARTLDAKLAALVEKVVSG